MGGSEDYYNIEEILTETRVKVKKPSMYKVLLHNDNYTPMDFVVMVLETIFHKSSTEANHLMWTVHKKEVGVAGIYTREVAETKLMHVRNLTKKTDYPFRCSMERE